MSNPSPSQWGLIILLVGLICYFSKPAIRWWRRRPWRIKGRALRGAKARVEGITPLPSPPATAEPSDDSQLRHYYLVHVTITPDDRSSKIPWRPLHLQVVPAERWNLDAPVSPELNRYCRVETMELVCGAIFFPPDEMFSVVGKFDVRLHLAVRHDIRILEFRYYLEQFGAFQLPAPTSAVSASEDLLVLSQSAVVR